MWVRVQRRIVVTGEGLALCAYSICIDISWYRKEINMAQNTREIYISAKRSVTNLELSYNCKNLLDIEFRFTAPGVFHGISDFKKLEKYYWWWI